MVLGLQGHPTLQEISVPGFHKVLRILEPISGLDAIIAIHDLRLSKSALGGIRIYPYASFNDALLDATRLARGMTYKSAAAQCAWGGGKSVINADPRTGKTEALLAAFAEAVNQLEGEYICAEDMGSTPEDVAIIAEYTPYVVGLPNKKSSDNPSRFTAWGVFRGIQAVLHQLFGTGHVAGRTIALQGLGSVGAALADFLFWHGAKLTVTDIDMEKAERIAWQYHAKLVEPDAIFDEPCDVFSPCALGGILNPTNVKRLQCKAVAGAANNQLLTEKEGEELHQMQILYAPDFVINAGGLINVTQETTELGYNSFVARNHVDQIFSQLQMIFDLSKKHNISSEKAVMQLIEYRLENGIGKRVAPIYMHHAGISF